MSEEQTVSYKPGWPLASQFIKSRVDRGDVVSVHIEADLTRPDFLFKVSICEDATMFADRNLVGEYLEWEDADLILRRSIVEFKTDTYIRRSAVRMYEVM